MYRRLIRPTRRLLAHWRKRPLAALTLMMVVLTAVAGPSVCLVDCWLHELRQAQTDPHGVHHQHAAFGKLALTSLDTAGDEHEQHREDGDGTTPSALTIAIVLLVTLVLPLRPARLLLPRTRRLLHSLAIPPPQRPPRCSTYFAFGAA